jgi:hypothetical protein
MKLTKQFDSVFNTIRGFNIKKVVKYLETKRIENKTIMQVIINLYV